MINGMINGIINGTANGMMQRKARCKNCGRSLFRPIGWKQYVHTSGGYPIKCQLSQVRSTYTAEPEPENTDMLLWMEIRALVDRLKDRISVVKLSNFGS